MILLAYAIIAAAVITTLWSLYHCLFTVPVRDRLILLAMTACFSLLSWAVYFVGASRG